MHQVGGESPGRICGGGVVCLPSTLKTHLNNHDTNWELVGINLDGERGKEGREGEGKEGTPPLPLSPIRTSLGGGPALARPLSLP